MRDMVNNPANGGGTLSGQTRLIRAGLAAGAAALLIAVASVSAGPPMLACTFRELTGLSCLTCGMTRSLQALMHGEFLPAIQYHLMGPVVLSGLLFAGVSAVVEAGTGKRLRFLSVFRRPGRILVWALGVWILYGTARIVFELIFPGSLPFTPRGR